MIGRDRFIPHHLRLVDHHVEKRSGGVFFKPAESFDQEGGKESSKQSGLKMQSVQASYSKFTYEYELGLDLFCDLPFPLGIFDARYI